MGTFTFQIRGPDVAQPTVYDEAFQLVAGDASWFGPVFHVVVQVTPADAMQPPAAGGCNAGGAGGAGIALALLGLVRRRRLRAR
jgi:uncharacterized protein (TIGR03382 family)